MVGQLCDFLKHHRIWVVGGAVVGAVGLLRWAMHRRDSPDGSAPMEGEVDRATFTKRNHVYMCIPPRIGGVPSISPFCVKLETWFRMVNIPYEVVETFIPSPSKKTFPYIYLNGEEMAETSFIIEKCAERFGKKVDKHLTEMERAIFVAYSRLLEEHLTITYAWHRYTLGADAFWENFLPPERLGPLGKFMAQGREYMKTYVEEKAYHRGISRHSPKEVNKIAEEDLQSISVYLGQREFFFGREPSVIDCSLFGNLIQIVCLNTDFPPRKRLFSEWKNLEKYVERMKIRLYPDWDRICNPQPSVVEPTNQI